MRILSYFCVVLALVVMGLCGKALAQGQDEVYGTNTGQNPQQGRVHTYTDPQTGDVITSVRPKRQPKASSNDANSLQMPIYVVPEIRFPTGNQGAGQGGSTAP